MKNINQNFFNNTAAVVFIFAGGLHLVRAGMGWELAIGGFVVPIWLSVLVGIIVLYLAYSATALNRKKTKEKNEHLSMDRKTPPTQQ